ncbi:MAG: B12-binding domain-containing protein, partial [Peptococcaceae bacterium]|nr:B12-binding domain-containing protein [Peptococcaceae bacterium]
MLDLAMLTQAIGDLEEQKVMDVLNEFVASNPPESEIQKTMTACQAGMTIVGDKFETGEYFVADLIYAGELLSGAINILKSIIGSASTEKTGKIVLGTVHGD